MKTTKRTEEQLCEQNCLSTSMKLIVALCCCCLLALYAEKFFRVQIDSTQWCQGIFAKRQAERSHDRIIPPVLFKTGPDDWSDMPSEVCRLIDSTVSANPDYTLRYYSDADARKFLQTEFESNVVKAFDLVRPGAYKADILRYALLYKFGGVYSDLTQVFLKPLDELVPRGEELVLVQDKRSYDFLLRPVKNVQISFMAARAGMPLFKLSLDTAVRNVLQRRYNTGPLDVTGPKVFATVLFTYLQQNTNVRPFIGYYQTRASISDIHTREVVIWTKSCNHNHAIHKTLWTNYGVMWATRRLY